MQTEEQQMGAFPHRSADLFSAAFPGLGSFTGESSKSGSKEKPCMGLAQLGSQPSSLSPAVLVAIAAGVEQVLVCDRLAVRFLVHHSQSKSPHQKCRDL